MPGIALPARLDPIPTQCLERTGKILRQTGAEYPNMVKIFALSGSARKQSYNQRLVRIAATGAKIAGAEVTEINLADFPMPIFNQDLEAEQGMPEAAGAIKKLMIGHDGMLIASQEYNSAYSALLKNAIDWASRKEVESEPPLQAFRGKVVTLMSASPGALGGLRGLVVLRMLLGNLGMIVLSGSRQSPMPGRPFMGTGHCWMTVSSRR